MSEPTQKQLDYAEKLGIAKPQGYTKQELSKAIDEKVNKVSKPAPKPAPSEEVSRHDLVINRVEKPHSFEFGKAGERHKVYYKDVKELKAHIEALEAEGFYYPSGTEVPIKKV